MINKSFVIIGTLIGTSGAIAYLIKTISGKVKPNRVSFLLWSVAPIIAFAAQIKQGVGIESLMTFSTGFFPLLTFAATFINKRAEWKMTLFDFVCGILSFIGLILWIITRIGNVAILFSIIADGFAALPTIKKSYNNPATEIAWPWIATCIGVVLTLFTLKELTFTNSGFIIYIFFVNLLIFCILQFKIKNRIKTFIRKR